MKYKLKTEDINVLKKLNLLEELDENNPRFREAGYRIIEEAFDRVDIKNPTHRDLISFIGGLSFCIKMIEADSLFRKLDIEVNGHRLTDQEKERVSPKEYIATAWAMSLKKLQELEQKVDEALPTSTESN